jgi:hypothetical protein
VKYRSRSLAASIENLVYRTAEPVERVKQDRRVVTALIDVVDERRRQEDIGARKRTAGIDWRSCADPDMAGGDDRRLAVLGEEFGEVARALLEREFALTGEIIDAHLRTELVQVAAVALAWIEAIDTRGEG